MSVSIKDIEFAFARPADETAVKREFGLFCPETAGCMAKQLTKLAAAGGPSPKTDQGSDLKAMNAGGRRWRLM